MHLSSIVIAADESQMGGEFVRNVGIGLFALGQATWFWGNILAISCEVRIAMSMFLQLNPYYEPFATLWTFTDPMFNFGRLYYPKILGFDVCPWANMFVLQQLIMALDVWIHGVNDMNNPAEREPMMSNLSTNPKYALVEGYLKDIKPETEKEWLESFSFEDIYFHRVPGAPPLLDGPVIKIDTPLPISDRLPTELISVSLDDYGISLDENPLTIIYNMILGIIHIPVNLLHLFSGIN